MIYTPINPFIIIDGSSYLYRAYYAFPHLSNSEGEPTNAIYGVLSMLRNIIRRYRPTHAAVVFDEKGKTFRNRIFKHYKSNRTPMPCNLRVQIKPLCDMIRAMGLPLIMIPEVEADDVIGTLAHEIANNGHSVLVSSIDKDMAQLVRTNINIINTMTNTILGPKEVKIKYGVSPKLIIDLIALTGDLSDNIPGVPGIGIKTAQMLLQTFDGLDVLYSEIERIANMMFRGAKNIALKLEKNKDLAYLSYQLATIKTDVSLSKDYKQLIINQPSTIELFKLFNKYGFKNWVKNIATCNFSDKQN